VIYTYVHVLKLIPNRHALGRTAYVYDLDVGREDKNVSN
jgi:hypothetical protein